MRFIVQTLSAPQPLLTPPLTHAPLTHLHGSMRKDSMGKQDDDVDQLIASLGEVLALTDDSQSLGGGLTVPYAIDVAAIRNKTGLSQAVSLAALGCLWARSAIGSRAAARCRGRPASCWRCWTAIQGLSRKLSGAEPADVAMLVDPRDLKSLGMATHEKAPSTIWWREQLKGKPSMRAVAWAKVSRVGFVPAAYP
jgi:hypothetical protein